VGKATGLASLLVFALLVSDVQARPLPPAIDNLGRLNHRLHGHVEDHTHHHKADNRIWSNALCEKRDIYVYLPPCYDPSRQYPIMIWLHGFMQDENDFIDTFVIEFDRAIAAGKIPPMIIAAPDGSSKGRFSLLGANSFFINSDAGNYEDYLIEDVWPWLLTHYPIRPEREAHILAGISMGGFAAFNQAMKHRDLFKVAAGVYPPLNLRWVDCHGRYWGNFDPNCWGWREDVSRGREVIGRFGFGSVKIRLRRLVDPLFGRGPETIARLSYENPIEMLDRLGIVDGELDMFVVYGGRDNFNVDAQIDSFLYAAKQRGITVGYCKKPLGGHNTRVALKLFPCIIDFLGRVMAPYFDPDVQFNFPLDPPEPAADEAKEKALQTE
jgi:S-formylglutathione hydrolase FrmB